jgi:hypothetical protein
MKWCAAGLVSCAALVARPVVARAADAAAPPPAAPAKTRDVAPAPDAGAAPAASAPSTPQIAAAPVDTAQTRATQSPPAGATPGSPTSVPGLPAKDGTPAVAPAKDGPPAATPATPTIHPKPPTEKQLKETAEFVDMPAAAGSVPPKPKPVTDEKEAPGYIPGYRRVQALSLSPNAPQGPWTVPGITPTYGERTPSQGLRFDFHGYLQMPVRAGIGSRPGAAAGQSSTTLHGDPLLPGSSFGWFDQTPTSPWPWAQLNFVVGNDVVQATAILGAWNIGESMTASTYFQAPAQVWFNDVFLTYTPKTGPIGVKFVVGSFPERYGYMAQYTLGAYPAPFIGFIRGVGGTTTVTFPFEYDLDLKLEAGFKGDINHPPATLAPSPSNNFSSPAYGSTFAGHGHASLSYKQTYTLALHFIDEFEQDNRRDHIDDPATPQIESSVPGDGTLRIAGADVTINGGRFGYFYGGAVSVEAHNAMPLDDLVQVLNTGGGKLLLQRYLGSNSNGNGGLLMFGSQYTLSLGTLLRYPQEFWGEGPDLIVSLFGIYASTHSPDPAFDGRQMFKYGAELTYSVLPWLALSGRVDHVLPDTSNGQESFAVFSPRLIFRSGWQARETLSLQYAAYALGDKVIVNGDNRLMNSPSGHPDTQMLALSATMWW